MPRLLLFANLREAAGTAQVELEGATVGEVLDAATTLYGERFRSGLASAAVWVNGEPAVRDQPIDRGDEVAVIPPVSGGAQATISTGSLQVGVAVVTVGALIAGNLLGPPFFAAALVGVAALWAVDIARESVPAGVGVSLPPVLATILAAVAAAHLLGGVGLGLAAAFAVVATLAWAVFRPQERDLAQVTSTTMVALVSGLGVASLFLVRARPDDGVDLIWAFLFMVGAGALLAYLTTRFLPRSRLDPFTVGTATVLVAGVAAALLWDLGVAALLLAAVAVAAGTIAGRTLGSMIRNGRVVLTERAPGTLTGFDGAVVAAGLYFSVLNLVLA